MTARARRGLLVICVSLLVGCAPGWGLVGYIGYIGYNSPDPSPEPRPEVRGDVVVGGERYEGIWFQEAELDTVSGSLVDGGQCTQAGMWKKKVVLCRRGGNDFADKLRKVLAGGGVGAIVYHDGEGLFRGTVGEWIPVPVIGVGRHDGEALRRSAGSAVTLRTRRAAALPCANPRLVLASRRVPRSEASCVAWCSSKTKVTGPAAGVACSTVDETSSGCPATLVCESGACVPEDDRAWAARPSPGNGRRHFDCLALCKGATEVSRPCPADSGAECAAVVVFSCDALTPTRAAPMKRDRPGAEDEPCTDPMPGVPNTGLCQKGLLCRGSICVSRGGVGP